ncbi:uncharacterized protein N7511_009837 [Penicillium nucicola]|uniref:uncharacterized protein n=1 Tax=Penicillium nucicola TaxID=1850975 RepID=UPI002544EB5B|nr:uncharacterized protein N7511_009837 [Penicillium nucicola]KAJ5748141.1 hypothetical protein N7511_009837 [Penicillium nucicola]
MPRKRVNPDSTAGLPSPRRQRQSTSPTTSDSEDGGPSAPSSTDAMVKKMVRLAMASEYSRLPIRRTDISAKVLGEQGSRQFKLVFEQAQKELRARFGMEMSELPAREKVTISQRRAAQKSEKTSSTNKSWILTSTLPPAYRTPAILHPPKAPSTWAESTYTGLYSFIIAVITLNGGTLAEQKLDRYLGRVNADIGTPIDQTEKLLQRLCKEGAVYGKGGEGDGDEGEIERMEREDFEGRLGRTLGDHVVRGATGEDAEGASQGHGNGPVEERSGRRSSRQAQEEEEEDGSEESD